jgi:membrane protease YdiL (CAAX protease family)
LVVRRLAAAVPLVFAALGLGMLLPGVAFAPDMSGFLERFPVDGGPEREEILRRREAMPVHPMLLAVAQGLAAGLTVNALAAFGEELGWRGLLHRLLRPMGFWKSSLATGILWGLWHAPIILLGHNFPQHPQAGVPLMVAFTVLLSPIFTWIRDVSGSVIAAAILHGSINALAGLTLVFLKGGSDLAVGMTGLAGLTVLAAANLLLFTAKRRTGPTS